MMVDIANEQVGRGHKVVIIILNDKIDKDIYQRIDANIQVYLLKRKPGSISILPILKLFFVLLQKKQFRFIHCHGLYLGRLLKYISSKRRILTIHAMNYDVLQLRHFHKLVAISNAVKHDIESRSKFCPVVVYNGVKIHDIKSRDLSSNSLTSSTINIVQVGRLDSNVKGQDILLRALSTLQKHVDPLTVMLDFVGGGVSSEELMVLTTNLGLTSNVRFLGNKSRDWVYEHLCDYDIFVQPSRSEGFGLTVVEALASKVPVIVADNDGPAEIVGYGKYGFVFKKNDVDDLVAKLVDAIELINGNDLESFVENAYQYSCMNFDIKRTAEQYLSEYQKLLVKND